MVGKEQEEAKLSIVVHNFMIEALAGTLLACF